MTLDELMKENADVLQRMKEEDDRYDVRRLAHEWWNWGSIITDSFPPDQLYPTIMEYILKHPEEFKGAGPQ